MRKGRYNEQEWRGEGWRGEREEKEGTQHFFHQHHDHLPLSPPAVYRLLQPGPHTAWQL